MGNSMFLVHDWKLLNSHRIVVVLLFQACMYSVNAWSQQDLPDLSELGIVEVRSRGSGCPSEVDQPYWTSVVPGEPANYLEVLFQGFRVFKEAGSSSETVKQRCRITVIVRFPKGYSVAPTRVDVLWRGFVDLPEGYKARFAFAHRVQRDERQLDGRELLVGPALLDDWTFRQRFKLKRSDFRGCRTGRAKFHFSAAVRLRGQNPQLGALIDLDSSVGRTRTNRQRWKMRWKKCTNSG